MAEERATPRMSERWIPLLAAVVGLFGGAAGAYVGGSVANEGQQQRFENEQTAEARDLRLDAYADLLRACEAAYEIDEATSPARKSELVGELTAAQARASLITSSTDVQQAADELGPNEGACGKVAGDVHQSAKDRFIDAAQPEVAGE
jgi:hypothetical protein